MTQLLLNTLKGEPADRVPFWYMRQAGRYLPEYRDVRATTSSFLEFCHSPDKAAEVTLQPIRRFDMDGAILFADILVLPDVMGQTVWFEKGVGPQLTPIRTSADLNRLGLQDMEDKVGAVFKTVETVRAALPAHKTLIGFAGAPWTVATYMVAGEGTRDQAPARRMGYHDPALFERLLQMLAKGTARYLIGQIRAGADAVQLFDSWAGAIPDSYFDRWVIGPTRAIVDDVRRACPGVPIIGFPRLAGTLLERFVRETGVDAVSLDSGVSVNWAATRLQPKLPVQGLLDPHLVHAGGEAMEKEALRILDGLKDGAHVFNLGHGFTPDTPIDHVAALSRLVKGYRR
ncbi:uroporphyrinogen decarboxylase [Yunchengibacter salinarum]|uniref:uroporphyrinogen decarboxylase n=1 Tax=Yunchengibacter salinarum TaxID=3133399 RepID=UPI0035B5FA90